MQILCGDIGSSYTRFGVVEKKQSEGEKNLTTVTERRYYNHQFNHFEDALYQFKHDIGYLPKIACFAVAGTVSQGRQAKMNNLKWHFDSVQLQCEFSFVQAIFLDVFSAIAHSIPVLNPQDLTVVQKGNLDPQGARVVIGAGNELGVVQSVYQNGKWLVLPSLGGHIGFAPSSAFQHHVLRWMSISRDYVDYEDMLSGQGLVRLYRYLGGAGTGSLSDKREFNKIINDANAAALIGQRAVMGKDDMACEAVHQFFLIYGAFAGNLALNTLAYGGIYITGGIAIKLKNWLLEGRFLKAFRSKGKMASIMKDFPVYLITSEDAGLIGAAVYGLRQSR